MCLTNAQIYLLLNVKSVNTWKTIEVLRGIATSADVSQAGAEKAFRGTGQIVIVVLKKSEVASAS